MTRSEEAYVGQGELHSALLLRPSHLQLEMLRPAAVVLVEGVPSVRTEEPAGHPFAETSQCAAQCSALQSVCVLQGSVVKVREHSALHCSTAQCLTYFLSTSLQNLRLSSSPHPHQTCPPISCLSKICCLDELSNHLGES